MMRRGRAFLVLGFGVLIGLVGNVAAAARTVAVDRQGYAVTGFALPGFYAPEDRLYVETLGGAEQARSFVLVEVTSSVRALILSLTEASGNGEDSVRAGSASVVACPVAGPFAPGPQPEGEVPEEDCASAVAGSRDERGRWTFDLSSFATLWAAGSPNHGVVIKPLPDAGATWRLVFDAARSSASIEEAPSLQPVPTAPAVIRPAPAVAPPTASVWVPPSQAATSSPAPPSDLYAREPTGLAQGSAPSAHSERGRWPLVMLVVVPLAAAGLGWTAPVGWLSRRGGTPHG